MCIIIRSMGSERTSEYFLIFPIQTYKNLGHISHNFIAQRWYRVEAAPVQFDDLVIVPHRGFSRWVMSESPSVSESTDHHGEHPVLRITDDRPLAAIGLVFKYPADETVLFPILRGVVEY